MIFFPEGLAEAFVRMLEAEGYEVVQRGTFTDEGEPVGWHVRGPIVPPLHDMRAVLARAREAYRDAMGKADTQPAPGKP